MKPLLGGRYRFWFMSATAALYLASFALPAITVRVFVHESDRSGPAVLWDGLEAFVELGNPAILAHPCFLLGFVLCASRRWAIAALFGGVAVLLILGTLLLYQPDPTFDHELYWESVRTTNEPPWPAAKDHKIARLLSGYYCWLASAVLLTIGSSVGTVAGRWARAVRDSPNSG
jgi:hypothetical protein